MSNAYRQLMRQKRAKGVAFSREEARAFDKAKVSEMPRRLYGIRKARQDRALRELLDAAVRAFRLNRFLQS